MSQFSVASGVEIIPGPYTHGPDSSPKKDVPQGKTTQHTFVDSKVFPGSKRHYSIYVPAQCDPQTHSGLLTHRNGQYAHPHREHNQEIRPDVTTFFSMLKQNGYRTGLIGKDHIRPLEKYPIDFKPRVGSRDVIKIGALNLSAVWKNKKPHGCENIIHWKADSNQ